MKFEDRDIIECEGWALAHSLAIPGKRLPKATILTAALIEELHNNAVTKAQVFKLDPEDMNEDAAALQAANMIAGDNIDVKPAGRGRANLLARSDGVFLPDNAVDFINTLDDAFSAACKRPFARVSSGELVATIKIVPYGIPGHVLMTDKPAPKCRIANFKTFRANLISTGDSVSEKIIGVLTNRLSRVHGELQSHTVVKHSVSDVAGALGSMPDSDLVLLLGASAISDRRDVLPAAVEKAGGKIIKLGMPADPGNLLMLAQIGEKTVIGLPGCARSPALNGFDWILERFAAGLPLGRPEITSMGTGGLLKESVGRPAPRNANSLADKPATRQIAAIVLAAGKSSRSGDSHKLLAKVGENTVIEATIQNARLSGIQDLFLVTGSNHERIAATVANSETHLVHNENFVAGMGSSLAAGIVALPPEIDYAFVCLGDMPFIRASTFKTLKAEAKRCSERAILIPTFNGKRGHPVLWSRAFFTALSGLTGDVGGKRLLEEHSDAAVEIPVDDPGILIDLDTPELLAQFGVKPADP